MNKSEIWKNYRFPIILLSGIMIGAVIGVIFGEKAKVLAPLGDIFLNLMFTIVVPMVFVSISSAVGNMVNMKRLGKILSSLVMVFVITGAIAGVLVLVVVNVFPPAAGTSIHFAGAEMEEMSGIGEMVVGALTVDDFSGLMSRKNMLPIIVFAILSGFCVSACGGEDSPVGRMLNNLNSIIMKIVSIIMLYAPIGLGAYFASLVGEFGPGLIGDYGHAMLVYYPMCILYFMAAFPAYSYFAGGKEGVRRMFKHILNPAVTAFATQSSIAALPVNCEACDKIGVPRDIRDIVLPMGATMHMDGSVLSSIVKISFPVWYIRPVLYRNRYLCHGHGGCHPERLCAVRCSRGRPGGRNAHCQSLRLSGRSIPADCHHRISGGPGRNLPQCQRRYHCFHDGDQAGGRKRLAGKTDLQRKFHGKYCRGTSRYSRNQIESYDRKGDL